jgi:hypothetical protein
MIHMEEYLPGKHKTLCSNVSTTHKKKKKKNYPEVSISTILLIREALKIIVLHWDSSMIVHFYPGTICC